MKGILTRTITKEECPWLNEDLEKGTEVFLYDDCTFGCISPGGVAVTLKENRFTVGDLFNPEFKDLDLEWNTFMQVPQNSIEWEKENAETTI